GLRIVWFQLVVSDRPGGRNPVVMAQLAEVLLPEAVQRSAEHLGRAADEIMHLRLKRPTVAIIPCVGRDVAVVLEHRRRIPIFCLALEPVAALENQDALPRWRELPRERAAARAAADDDNVEAPVHVDLH